MRKPIVNKAALVPSFKPQLLAAFHFGIQLMWGAILAVSLQARTIELSRGDQVVSYALIATVGASIAALVQLVAGRLSDAHFRTYGNRNLLYLAGAAGAVPCLLWLYGAPNLPQLLSAFIGLQVATNVATGPYQAAIPDYAPRDKQGETSSWMSVFQSLGGALGLLIAGFVHNELVVGVLLALGFSGSFLMTFRFLQDRLPTPSSEAEPVSYRALIPLLISRGFLFIGFYTMLGFLLFFVRDTMHVMNSELARTDTALLFLTFTFMAIIGAIVTARPIDRYDKRLIITIGASMMAFALIALAFSATILVAGGCAIVAGLAWGALATADWALACTLLPRKRMATSMGIWNLATAIPQMIAPACAAPLVLFGNSMQPGCGPRLAIALAGFAIAAGGALIWRTPNESRDFVNAEHASDMTAAHHLSEVSQ